MKSKSLLFLLTATCLFSCQQQDEQKESSKEVINVLTSIDDNITNIATRADYPLSLPLKSGFSTGEVISMSINNQDYTPYTLGMDSHTWDEIGANTATTFYAHYPEVSSIAATRSGSRRFREVEGGKEYLFGTAQAIPGFNNVMLKFKRMTVPVILLDEYGKPYTGTAQVKLFLKNKGLQDLFNGAIQVDESVAPKYIDIKKISDGILTHLIPQVIKAGEKIGTVIFDDKEQPIIAEEEVTLEPGQPVAMRISPRFSIIDDRTPLRH